MPGPSSTQTLVAIGHKVGGPFLALLTMLVWALPVLSVMTLLSFMGQLLFNYNISEDAFRYIGPMAVGFIIVAAWRIGKKVVRDRLTFYLLAFGAIITYVIREPWIFPLVLFIGGAVSIFNSKEKELWNPVKLNPPWLYLVAFGIFAVGSILLTLTWDNKIVHLFESFYRFGYLVIGGGQVVVPLMYTDLVEVRQYLTSQEFLTGFGLVQGLPGPMFSFSAYAGGMALRGSGTLIQTAGGMISGLAIFLPGLLLIYFIYPIWENLKEIKGIKVSLNGVTAVAGGLIVTSAFILMQKNGFAIDNLIILAITIILLLSKKIPAPLIVLGVIFAGFI